MADQIKISRQQLQGSSSLQPALHKEAVESRKVAPHQNSSRSYAEVANFTTLPHTPSQAVESPLISADEGIIVASGMHKKAHPINKTSSEDADGFTTVSYKNKPTSGTPSVNTVRHRRQPLIGVRNSVSLPIVSKRERSKALVVSKFSPEVTAADVEKSLKEQLSLKRLVCTRLKTKFNAYASFHISVIEEDFPLINNTGVRPSGCLIAPFYGKLTTDQVYSSSAPLTSVPAVVPSDGTKSPTTMLTSTREEPEGSITS
jgi:hypothetical protein